MNTELLNAHNDYIKRQRENGAPIFSYCAPCCGMAMETNAPKDEQVWDTLTVCPQCDGMYMKVCIREGVSTTLPPGCEGHDSRQHPAQGDRITVGGETREVERVSGDRVIYSWPGKVAVRTLPIRAWRTWAAQASSWSGGPKASAIAA